MKNLKIGTRLGIGFGIVLVIMTIMAIIAINRLAVVNHATTDMTANRIPKLLQVEEINEQLNIISRSSRNALLLIKDKEAMKKEIDRIHAARKKIGETFDKLDKSMVTPAGRKMVEATTQKRGPYVAGYEKLIQLIQEGKAEAAQIHMFGDFRKVQDAYFEQLDVFEKYLIDAMNKSSQEADDNYAMARMLMMVLAVIAAILGVVIAVWVTRSITKPLSEAVKVAETVASGDLTHRIEVHSSDETGHLMQALKNMNDSLVSIVSQVRVGTDTIATASAQIAAGNQDLSSRTEEQASSLEETASSMEELTSTVRQNADNARQANQLAVNASEVAIKGGEVVSQVVETMNAIDASSHKMADIINVIDGIAFQTNILALNAAVEAARAGEQGRGFAVVATEVRNLAQRSAAAAREIKTLIDDSVTKVEAGNALVEQAGTTMNEVVSSIKRVHDIMGEITAASHEQSEGIEQVNQAITQMDQVTQQNAALVEEAAAAAESMQDQAGKLVEVVSVFRTGQAVSAQVATNPTKVVAKPAKVAAKAAVRLPVKSAPRPAAPVVSAPQAGAVATRPAALPPTAKNEEWEEF